MALARQAGPAEILNRWRQFLKTFRRRVGGYANARGAEDRR